MGWYKNILQYRLSKISSKMDIKQRALEQLNGGASSSQVAQEFVINMMKEDPSFPASQILPMRNDPVALKTFLNGLDITPETPIAPGTVPPQPPELPAQTPPTQTGLTPPEEIPVGPEGGAEEGEVSPQTAKGAPGEEGHVVGDEGEAILTDVTEQMEYAPDPNEKITMDPTIKGSYELPVSQIVKLRKKIDGINRKLRRRYHPEIKVEFEGDPYEKPITYKNRTAPVMEQFIRVKVSGVIPSPSELISARIHEPMVSKRTGKILYQKDGVTPRMNLIGEEPMGVRFIAKVHHHPLSDEEQLQYLKTEPPESHLRKIINNCREQGITPFFNTIEVFDGAFKIDAKFRYVRPQECYACKVQHARKSAYIGAVVPPEQMVHKMIQERQPDGSMAEVVAMENVEDPITKRVSKKPIKIIPEDLIADAPQEQFGGSCADETQGIKTIENLKKWIDELKNAEKKHTEKAKSKKYTGGTRGPVPADHLFATAINMLRDPKYQENPDRVMYNLPRAAQAYGFYLKQKEQEAKGEAKPNSYNSYRIRNARKIDEFDKDLASKVRAWWREKLGGIDLDLADSNKVSLSVLPTISAYTGIKQGRENIKNIVEMTQAYINANNVEMPPLPKPEPEPEPVRPRSSVFNPSRFRGTEPGTPLSVTPATPAPAPPAPPEPQQEPEGTVPPNLVDIKEVEKGDRFVSKLKYVGGRQWRTQSGSGTKHTFVDDTGGKYVVWDSYDPQKNFEAGKAYYIQGKKGNFNGRYRSTTLLNATKWEPEVVPSQPEEDTTMLGEPVETKQPPNLPKWYGKYDLGQLAENRIRQKKRRDGQPSTTAETIKAFLDRMADISDKWKQTEYRNGEEFTLNQLAKPKYGGEEKLIAKLKEIYERDRPKI